MTLQELYPGAPSFDEECAHVSREGKWESVRSMHAVASVTMETDKVHFPGYRAAAQYCFLPE